jgi:hypothetical protein
VGRGTGQHGLGTAVPWCLGPLRLAVLIQARADHPNSRNRGGSELWDISLRSAGRGGRRAIRRGRCDVSVGEALAEARRRVGLTVAEVGHQTGIREMIITAIEDDDYSACGGDSYARGTSAASRGLSALIRSH